MKNLILPEKEEMTDEEKTLFLLDIKRVCEEYFEADGNTLSIWQKPKKGFPPVSFSTRSEFANSKSRGEFHLGFLLVTF